MRLVVNLEPNTHQKVLVVGLTLNVGLNVRMLASGISLGKETLKEETCACATNFYTMKISTLDWHNQDDLIEAGRELFESFLL